MTNEKNEGMMGNDELLAKQGIKTPKVATKPSNPDKPKAKKKM